MTKSTSRLRFRRLLAWVLATASVFPLAAQQAPAPPPPPLDAIAVAQNPGYWPREVTLLAPLSFPVVFDGRVAGQTNLPAGTTMKLVRVAGAQVELENQGARQLAPIRSTDLLLRATRIRDAAAANKNPPPVGAKTSPAPAVSSQGTGVNAERAREIAAEIQRDFWLPQKGLYKGKPDSKDVDVVWGCGVMFSALVGAARNDPAQYQPILRKFFDGLDAYWDRQAPVPGYEPLPTNGNGNDKYYDDNEWLVISFLEAFELTKDNAYYRRAAETMKFVLSGWDETYLKGGIWWHQAHEKKTPMKNTCANAPAAVACLLLAKVSQPEEARKLVKMAQTLVEWTTANMQLPNALFADSRDIKGDGMNRAQLTYNSALMVRAHLGLYRWTGDQAHLREAQRIAKAADSLLNKNTGVFNDAPKWAHLMVEADLELYRTTHEPYLLERVKKQADAYYEHWKNKGPDDLINVSSYSRIFWLLADMDTESGRAFWKKADAPVRGAGASFSSPAIPPLPPSLR